MTITVREPYIHHWKFLKVTQRYQNDHRVGSHSYQKLPAMQTSQPDLVNMDMLFANCG